MKHKFTLLFTPLLLCGSSALAQTQQSEIDQLKAQVELLKQQQMRSLALIESLEKKIEAIQNPQAAPISAQPMASTRSG